MLFLNRFPCTFSLVSGYTTLEQNIEIENVNNAVSQYVTGSTDIVTDQTEVSVAMLFADIHDFNAMTGAMCGEQLFDWLEVYFEQDHRQRARVRGQVHRRRDVLCVHERDGGCGERDPDAMTDQLNGEIVCGGGTQLIQIGIRGDSRRHTCTLVSSDVNLASRLEGLTKFYGARIVVSASTIELCDRRTLAYRRLGSVKCKGRMNGIEICEVFQTDPLELKLFKRETMEEFHKGLDLQAANDMDAAKSVFSGLREKAASAELHDYALDLKLAQAGPVDEMT